PARPGRRLGGGVPRLRPARADERRAGAERLRGAPAGTGPDRGGAGRTGRAAGRIGARRAAGAGGAVGAGGRAGAGVALRARRPAGAHRAQVQARGARDAQTRMSAALTRLARHPRLPWALGLLAVALTLPALATGFQFDDFRLRAAMRGPARPAPLA